MLLALADLYADRELRRLLRQQLHRGAVAGQLPRPPAERERRADRERRGQNSSGRTGVRSGRRLVPLRLLQLAGHGERAAAGLLGHGAAPIVVVGTTRDPATPYQQAVKLAAELDSGVLLSRDGDGHTAYGQGNSCIDQAIDRYLVDGDPPADGTTC